MLDGGLPDISMPGGAALHPSKALPACFLPPARCGHLHPARKVLGLGYGLWVQGSGIWVCRDLGLVFKVWGLGFVYCRTTAAVAG